MDALVAVRAGDFGAAFACLRARPRDRATRRDMLAALLCMQPDAAGRVDGALRFATPALRHAALARMDADLVAAACGARAACMCAAAARAVAAAAAACRE